jgi:hypothetical protein
MSSLMMNGVISVLSCVMTDTPLNTKASDAELLGQAGMATLVAFPLMQGLLV